MAEKYSWFNPEAASWIRPQVEEMLLKFPSSSHLMYHYSKCGHYSAVNNSTPFGIDQLVAFMVNEFQAMEAKGSMAYVLGLSYGLGLPATGPKPEAGK